MRLNDSGEVDRPLYEDFTPGRWTGPPRWQFRVPTGEVYDFDRASWFMRWRYRRRFGGQWRRWRPGQLPTDGWRS